MLKTTKSVLIYIVTIIVTILIVSGIFLYPALTMTKEERILDKAMGKYHAIDYVSMFSLVTSGNAPSKENIEKTYLHMSPDVFAMATYEWDPEVLNIVKGRLEPKYKVMQVDEDFFNDGIPEHGAALRGNGLIPYSTDINTIKPFYAIDIETPKLEFAPQLNAATFYQIGDEYYIAVMQCMYKLEKVE